MKVTIGLKLLAGFLAIILLAGVIALVSINRLSEISLVTRDLAQKEIPEVHVLWKMRNLILGMDIDLQSFLGNREGQEHLVRLQEKDRAIKQSFAQFEVLNPLPSEEEGRLLRELPARYRSLQEATSSIISFIQSGQEEKASAFFRGKWQDLHQAVVESTDRLFDYEEQELEEMAALAETKGLSGRKTVIALALVSTLLSLALGFGITQSSTEPVKQFMGATEQAIRGNLASKIDVAKRDELGLLAQRFNDMMARLNQSFEDQRRFYADASHELRTPLTIIRGEAEVALRGPEKPVGEYREALETIVILSHQMGRLIDELLFLARCAAGQIRYEMEQIELDRLLLEEVYHQSKGLARLKGIHLKLDLSQPVEIRGDRERLKQLFLILVDNSIKYTPPGGDVKIGLRDRSEPPTVFVSDTGIGIPEKDLPHVFERFYRAEAARSRSHGGTGLGLAIAKSIVQAHNGEISVQSTPGEGTTFTVLLPRA